MFVFKQILLDEIIKEFTKLLAVFTLTFSRRFNDFVCIPFDIDAGQPLLFSKKIQFLPICTELVSTNTNSNIACTII